MSAFRASRQIGRRIRHRYGRVWNESAALVFDFAGDCTPGLGKRAADPKALKPDNQH